MSGQTIKSERFRKTLSEAELRRLRDAIAERIPAKTVAQRFGVPQRVVFQLKAEMRGAKQ